MRAVERLFLNYAADAYAAARLSGLSPEAAGRVVSEVVTDKIRNLKPKREEPEMPKLNEMYPSRWLAAAEIPDVGQTVTVRRIQLEEIGDGEKWVLYFEELNKGLVLNKTNSQTIASLYGDDTDDWEGNQITLFPTQVDFQGKQVDAIRVRNRKPQMAKPAAKAGKKPVVTQADVDGERDDIPF